MHYDFVNKLRCKTKPTQTILYVWTIKTGLMISQAHKPAEIQRYQHILTKVNQQLVHRQTNSEYSNYHINEQKPIIFVKYIEFMSVHPRESELLFSAVI